MIEYTVHPAADLFPTIKGKELDALVADIKANGLQTPIATLDGQILDGRNRLEACTRANVEPQYREVPEGTDPVAYVISANYHRRHMGKTAREKVWADMRSRGMSYRQIADADGTVSHTTVASGVKNFTPEKVTGKDGKQYKGQSTKPKPAAPTPKGPSTVKSPEPAERGIGRKKNGEFYLGWQTALNTWSAYRHLLTPRMLADHPRDYEKVLGYEIPSHFRDEAKCHRFVTDWDAKIGAVKFGSLEETQAEATQAEQQFLENAKVKDPVKTVAQLKESLEKEIHARLMREANQAVTEYKKELDAKYAELRTELYREVGKRRDAVEREERRITNRGLGIRPLMTQDEFKLFTGVCHADKWQDVGSSDKRVQTLQRLFHALQGLKDRIDPLTPIAELRKDGWSDIAPSYKKQKAKAA